VPATPLHMPAADGHGRCFPHLFWRAKRTAVPTKTLLHTPSATAARFLDVPCLSPLLPDSRKTAHSQAYSAGRVSVVLRRCRWGGTKQMYRRTAQAGDAALPRVTRDKRLPTWSPYPLCKYRFVTFHLWCTFVFSAGVIPYVGVRFVNACGVQDIPSCLFISCRKQRSRDIFSLFGCCRNYLFGGGIASGKTSAA